MADIEKITLHLPALNRLMTSAPVQAQVNERFARVANAAGPKFRLVVYPHKWTARAFVESIRGETLTDADIDRLLRALDAAG